MGGAVDIGSQLMVVSLATFLATDSHHRGATRTLFGLVAAVWAIGLMQDTVIALPGFLARHVYG